MRAEFEQWASLEHGEIDGSEWEPVGHREAGELVAVAMLKGTEIHFAVKPSWRRRLIQRDRTRAFLAPLMERAGFLSTRSVDETARDFLNRLGFVPTWREGRIQHYMLCGLPFGQGDDSCRW